MPPVLIPIITAAGVTGGIAIGTQTISYAAILAYSITTALTTLPLLFMQNGKKDRGSQQQVTIKQSMPPRTRSYGRVKRGGAFDFLDVGSGGALHQVIIHDEGAIAAIEEVWLNDKLAPLDGDGDVTIFPWGSNIRIESHLGATDQLASPMLLGAFGGGVWTADHRLRGLAYSVMRMGWVQEKNFGKVYPNGAPALRVVERASLVEDPRTGVTAWSENPALCLRDFLIHPRGLRIPAEMIDDASVSRFADICDQSVAIDGGGAEPRYRVGLTYELPTASLEVQAKLLAACDGEIYPTPEGKVGLRGGAWVDPVVTLDDSCVASVDYRQGNDRLSAFNRLKLTCTDPASDYQSVEIEPWEDLVSQAEIGVLEQPLELPQVPSWRQARRLAKIIAAKGNPHHRLTLSTHPAGILALGERTVRVRLAELDLDDTFLVEKCEIRIEDGMLAGLDLELVSLSAEAYGWSPAEEEGPAPVPPPDTAVPVVPPAPTGLVLASERTETSADTFVVRLRASVDALAGTAWATVGRYRKSGATTWLALADRDDWTVVSDALEDGATYEVQLAHAGNGGIDATTISWTTVQSFTAIADVRPPAPPTGLAAADIGGAQVQIDWINPGTSYFKAVQVWRSGTSSSFGTATLIATVTGAPGAAGSHTDTFVPAGTWRYWARAINRSNYGDATSTVGPATVVK